jgi:N-acetylglucosamine kinase-like BadF-type ATPase
MNKIGILKYVIGIDGGGTKTRMKLADMDGVLLACCEGGPSNINAVGATETERVLRELIREGLERIDGDLSGCMAACLGMAGAGRHEEKHIIREILKQVGLPAETTVTDDAVTALYGGVGSGEGIILISGTGSICYGRNRLGQTRRAGGWGYIAGDEGSGYDIGLHALRHALRSFDGREASSTLTGLVMEHVRQSGLDVVELVYRSGGGRNAIAQLAPLVDEAYAQGDSFAENILEYAARELMLSVKAVAGGLVAGNMEFKLALAGSVLEKSEYIRKRITEQMAEEYPLAMVFPAKDDAAWGAVRIALEHAGGGGDLSVGN